MADTDTDIEDDQEDGTPKGLRAHVKRLESQLREVQDRAARADALERELAFSKAGIDLNDSRTKYFVRGYDGDLDPDAIRKQAVNDGFLAAPSEPPNPALQASGRIDEAAAGEPSPDRNAEYLEAMRATKTTEEALAVAERFGITTSRMLQ